MQSGASSRRHGATLIALLLCVTHFSSFDISSRPLVTDVRYYAYFASRIADGAVPHADFFDNKTQLASFAGALCHAGGEWFGIDPLFAIRLGYLGFATLGGVLAFLIFRRLGAGAVAGWLGALAYCSFGLLGMLPAEGNIPKLLMAVCASAMALAVRNGSWFMAGLAGALAFMDWQIGALVWVAALSSAWVFGTPRWRSVAAVTAGGLAGVAPFAVYYVLNGALGETLRQVVASSWFRGATSLESEGLDTRLGGIGELVDLACSSQGWLFYAAFAGAAAVVWRMLSRQHREERPLLTALAIYHFGVTAFSLLDFQWYGDFFALLHTAAFFLGVLWITLYEWGAAWVSRHGTPRRRARGALAAGMILIAVATGRPGPLRPRFELRTSNAAPGATLADQREVADRIESRIGRAPLAFFESAELLFLMDRPNGTAAVYWNAATWWRYRSSPDEPFDDTALRVLNAASPAVIAFPRGLLRDPDFRKRVTIERIASRSDRYFVEIVVR
jgi:hypothetical protein